MRFTGVFVDSSADAVTGAVASSSSAICVTPLASLETSTTVSRLTCASLLKRNWPTLNGPPAKSRRMRTQSLDEPSSELCPRATSKSAENCGRRGIVASAVDISFCSASVGAQTLRTFTFTGGVCLGGAACCAAADTTSAHVTIMKTFRITAAL